MKTVDIRWKVLCLLVVGCGSSEQSAATEEITQGIGSIPTACVAKDQASLQHCVDLVNSGEVDNVNIAATISCATCGFEIWNCNRPLFIYGTGTNPGILRTGYTNYGPPVLYFTGCHPSAPIRVRNLTLEERRDDARDGGLLAVMSSDDISFEKMTLRNSAFAGMSIVASNDIELATSVVTNAYMFAYWVMGDPYPSSGLRLIGNTFVENDGQVFYISRGGEIRDNLFEHNHRRAFFGYSGGQLVLEAGSANVLVKSNVFKRGSMDEQCSCTAQSPPCVVNGIEFPNAGVADITMMNNDIYDQTGRGVVKNDGGSFSFGLVLSNSRLYNNAFGDVHFPLNDITLSNNCYTSTCPLVRPRGVVYGTPSPCSFTSPAGTCNSTISWNTADVPDARVYIENQLFAWAFSGSQNAPWIGGPGGLFELYDGVKGAGAELLHSTYVGGIQTACGDGACNGNETSTSCAADCPGSAYCGDGVCNGTETCNVCPGDCGSCTTVYTNSFESGNDFPTGWTTWHNCAADGNWSAARALNGVCSTPQQAGGYDLAFRTTAFTANCQFPGLYSGSPAIPATAGKKYFVDTWTRNDTAVGSTIVVFFSANGTQLQAIGGSWAADDDTFNQDATITAVAPPGTKSMRIRYDLYSPNETADIDLLTIRRTP